MKRGIEGAGALLLAWALLTGARAAWSLLFLTVSLWAALRLLRIYWLRSLACSVELRTVGGLHEGLFDISYVFANNGLIPIPSCLIHLHLDQELGSSRSEPQAVAFGAGGMRTLSRSFRCPRRGVYTLGGAEAHIPDLLGPGAGAVSFDRRVTVEVYPRRHPLQALPGAGLQTGGPLHGPRLTAGDNAGISRLRPAAPQEPVRHVHWKASARSEELQVIEFERLSRQGVVVLLDGNLEKYRADADGDVEERCVEVAAGLIGHWLERGIPVTLGAGPHPLMLKDAAALETGLRALMRFSPAPEPLLKSLRRFSGAGSADSLLQVVTPELRPDEAEALQRTCPRGLTVYCVGAAPPPETLGHRTIRVPLGDPR